MEYSKDLDNILFSNYMPYAEETITDRAIPFIDGLKPVQRRLLYTMHTLGVNFNGLTKKSQKINGATMSLHPHGDSSIYEAMVLLTTGYEGQNVPLVHSKGSFGKKYSRDLKYAAPRYTEVKLAAICKELFDGIDEDAVDFIDNFDATEKEPSLLPVKFPLILTNNSDGVAVGTSSSIPTFSLKNVCLATIGILDGTITTPEQLASVLSSLEFTTGGYVHSSHERMTKLCETGVGSFTISGRAQTYTNQIVIDQIPYTTTAEEIIESISKAQDEKKLQEIKDVRDEIGLDGLKIVIELKNNSNANKVLQDLYVLTPLRSKISFRTRAVIGGRCKSLNIMELIKEWVKFRQDTINRIYKFRLKKDTDIESKLTVWEKIINDSEIIRYIIGERDKVEEKDIYKRNYKTDDTKKLVQIVKQKLRDIDAPESVKEVSRIIADSDEDQVLPNVKKRWNLTDAETTYITDMRARNINADKVAKDFVELIDTRNRIAYCNKVISDDNECYRIMINDLKYIIDNYATSARSAIGNELTEADNRVQEAKISEEKVTIILTKNGFVRRLTSMNDLYNTYKNGDDYEIKRWVEHNHKHLLVFDRFGTVHKIPINDIDAGHGKLTDKIYQLANVEKEEDIVFVDVCGDYSNYFNIIYPNGHGTRVYYSKAQGNRQKYKNCFEAVQPKQYFITKETKFFLITARNKATYVDLTNLGTNSNRTAFKSGRLYSKDSFIRLIPIDKVPNISLIDLDKYSKDYTVAIKDDLLYVDQNAINSGKNAVKDYIKNNYNKAETSDNKE